jgi:hypothetical protein
MIFFTSRRALRALKPDVAPSDLDEAFYEEGSKKSAYSRGKTKETVDDYPKILEPRKWWEIWK